MGLQLSIRKRLGTFSLELDLETEPGEAVGLFGASGSGKSLTLLCVAGIIRPDEGKIVLNGRTLYDSSRRIDLPPGKRRTGLMFQSYALFPRMTVGENIACGIREKRGQKEEIRRILKLLRLDGAEDRYPGQLSGGQQQRAALARMMASRPEIYMFDEPFSALDRQLKDEIEEDFRKALEDFHGPVLYVSHAFGEIQSFCSRVAVLAGGRILERRTPEDLYRRPASLTAAELIRCENIQPAVKTGPDRVLVPGWNVSLDLPGVSDGVRYVGLHAGDVLFGGDGGNRFSAGIAGMVRRPRETEMRLLFPGAAVPVIVKGSRREMAWLDGAAGTVPVRIPEEALIPLVDPLPDNPVSGTIREQKEAAV